MDRLNTQTVLREVTQDKTCKAWKKLCYIIDKIADEEKETFDLYQELGKKYYYKIQTLPKSISKLKKVKTLNLYGSKIVRIPPEIGEMNSLEKFLPYTSYGLHWFPYEILNCPNLKESTISTRALYGNYKGTLYFPDLKHNFVNNFESVIECSVCRKEMSNKDSDQYWISLWIGTDVVPLLVNSCSDNCLTKLPRPPKDYIQNPHKGGISTKREIKYYNNTMFGAKTIKKSLVERLINKIIKK